MTMTLLLIEPVNTISEQCPAERALLLSYGLVVCAVIWPGFNENSLPLSAR